MEIKNTFLEENLDLVKKLPIDNQKQVAGAIFDFIKERSEYKEPITPSGVYQRRRGLCSTSPWPAPDGTWVCHSTRYRALHRRSGGIHSLCPSL